MESFYLALGQFAVRAVIPAAVVLVLFTPTLTRKVYFATRAGKKDPGLAVLALPILWGTVAFASVAAMASVSRIASGEWFTSAELGRTALGLLLVLAFLGWFFTFNSSSETKS